MATPAKKPKLKRSAYVPKKSSSLTTMTDEVPIKNVVALPDTFKGGDLKYALDRLEVHGCKGYQSAMASHSVIEGTYYFEVKILQSPKEALFPNVEPHVRIGLASSKFDKEVVLGYDKLSYSWRDSDGALFHQGIKKEYGQPYGIGDIVGCLIHMKPPKPKFLLKKDESGFAINEGSKVYFFRNGANQGLAFCDINQAFYFAGVSLYMNAFVRVNFGPEFECVPNVEGLEDEIALYKPYSILVDEPKIYSDLDDQ